MTKPDYRKIFLSSPCAIIVLENGVISGINEKACRLFRCKAEDIEGNLFRGMIVSRSDAGHADAHPLSETAGTLFTEKRNDAACELLRPDGTVLNAEIEGDFSLEEGSGFQVIVLHDNAVKKSLRDSIEKMEFIAEHSGEEIYIVNPDGALEYVNRAAADSLGYTVQEMISMGIAGFDRNMKYNTPESYRHHFEELKKNDIPPFETIHETKNGSLVFKTIKSYYMNIGEREYVCGFGKDISEIKQTRKALVESEERFETVFDQSFHLMGLLDTEGTLIVMNKTAVKYLEDIAVDPGTVLGKPFWETPWWIHDNEQQERLKKAVEKSAGGDIVRFDAHHLLSDGDLLWVDFSLKPVLDANSEVMLILAEGSDITESRKIEEWLRISEKRYHDLVDLLPQPVYECDLAGDVTFANRFALKIFGYSEEDYNNKLNIYSMIAPEDRERADKNITLLLGGGKAEDHNFNAVRKDGSRFPVLIYSSPIVIFEKTVGLRGVVFDVTEQKKYEEMLMASLREKDTMFKEIHHRVKNNLQIMVSLLSLQKNSIHDETVQHYFTEIQNRIRAMSLIHEKLYSTENFSRVNFGEYLREITMELEYVYRSRAHQPELEFLTGDITLSVDQAIPCALMANEIVSNAFKYAFPENLGRKGRLTVTFDEDSAGKILFTISDNGVGLPDSTNPAGNADTLGLELVHILVKQLEGRLDIMVDGGTSFSISFMKNNGG